MTWCELFAVFAALSTYRSLLRHSCVLFVVDNETDVHILNRQATRSARLAGLLREIYTISTTNNISIYARHRKGIDNVLADFLSRPSMHGHTDIVQRWRHLHPELADRLSHVSIVCSNEFICPQVLPSSPSISPSHSAPTPSDSTPHISQRWSPSVGSWESIPPSHSQSRTSAAQSPPSLAPTR